MRQVFNVRSTSDASQTFITAYHRGEVAIYAMGMAAYFAKHGQSLISWSDYCVEHIGGKHDGKVTPLKDYLPS